MELIMENFRSNWEFEETQQNNFQTSRQLLGREARRVKNLWWHCNYGKSSVISPKNNGINSAFR
jgi:hypothetical protein